MVTLIFLQKKTQTIIMPASAMQSNDSGFACIHLFRYSNNPDLFDLRILFFNTFTSSNTDCHIIL